MIKKALIVVDPENDFFPGGALGVPRAEKIIRPLNCIIIYAENEVWLIIYSKDWHPLKTSHFDKWPVHCVENTYGAEFHPKLRISNNGIIILKGTEPDEDSYSPFEGHTDSGSSLEDILRFDGVEEVYIGGLATDYCVKACALDAIKKGFKTHLLLDACRAVTKETGKKAVKEMKDAGVVITTTKEVMKNETN